MIKADFQLERTDDVQATLQVTMSLKDWRALMRQLGPNWPSWEFADKVHALLAAADKHFTTRIQGSPESEESEHGQK